MSPRQNTDVPLPHASLLSYFFPTSQPLEHSPSYSATLGSDEKSGYKSPPSSPLDEELGFWGEYTPSYTDRSASLSLTPPSWLRVSTSPYYKSDAPTRRYGLYTFCCTWCLLSVSVLFVFGILLSIDTGVEIVAPGSGLRNMLFGSQEESRVELPFCLETPNRQAPGPQSWRYIPAAQLDQCEGERLVLSAGASEYWKLRMGDEVLVEGVMGNEEREEADEIDTERRPEEEEAAGMRRREKWVQSVVENWAKWVEGIAEPLPE